VRIELQCLNLVDGFEQWSLPRPISYGWMKELLHGAADPLISKNTIEIHIGITIVVPPKVTDAVIVKGTKKSGMGVKSLKTSRSRKAGKKA